MEQTIGQIREASAFVEERGKLRPKLAVQLGSGLGALARELSPSVVIPFADIPHFPSPSVAGHAGRVVVGRFAGVPLAVIAGRVHAYEGFSASEVVFPVRVLGLLGAKILVLTNAAGAINTAFRPGELMLITDHLNLTGKNPLVGPEDAAIGPRFTDMTEAYPQTLRELSDGAARGIGIVLRKGVYAGLLGPSFETPAEIRMLRGLGADAVGMSTVLEAIAANQMGIKVLGISCLTNMAAGITPKKLEHRDVLEIGERTRGVFVELLQEVLPRLAKLG
jgi:purine-nucleoside phosphorylase